MSFGFSISDIVLSIQLAHNLWQESRNAPADFRAVSTEVASLKLVLQEIQETVSDRPTDQVKRTELAQLIDGLNDVLAGFRGLLHKYRDLGTQSKRTWDRLRWGKEPIEKIRLRLVTHVSLLISFRSTLLGGSLARIEGLLEQLVLEHQSGLRDHSIISADSVESIQEGDTTIWQQLGRELEDIGISQTMIRANKDFIIAWIKNALQAGRFDEVSPESFLRSISNSPIRSPDPDSMRPAPIGVLETYLDIDDTYSDDGSLSSDKRSHDSSISQPATDLSSTMEDPFFYQALIDGGPYMIANTLSPHFLSFQRNDPQQADTSFVPDVTIGPHDAALWEFCKSTVAQNRVHMKLSNRDLHLETASTAPDAHELALRPSCLPFDRGDRDMWSIELCGSWVEVCWAEVKDLLFVKILNVATKQYLNLDSRSKLCMGPLNSFSLQFWQLQAVTEEESRDYSRACATYPIKSRHGYDTLLCEV